MPTPSSTRPSSGDRSDGARSPRRPASTATTSWREARYAGTTAARNALSMPKPAMPTRCSHGTSNGPNQVSDRDWSSGCEQPRDADAERPPRARRPRCRARGRRRRRPAATASAYPRWPPSAPGCAAACGRSPRTPGRPAAPPRSAPSPRSAPARRPWRRRCCAGCTSAGISEAGGGSLITARDATVAPMPLSWRTVAHETGPPSTSHARLLPVSTPKAPSGPAAAGKVADVVDSATPTIVGSAGASSAVELERVADRVALVEHAPG